MPSCRDCGNFVRFEDGLACAYCEHKKATCSGEELNRKYWELCGWKLRKAYVSEFRSETWQVWHAPDCNEYEQHTVHFGIGSEPGNCTAKLPPLHLDANLAIAEADKVFVNSKGVPYYDLYRDADQWAFDDCNDEKLYHGVGQHALCEAILRALIAAKESK